VSVLSEPLGAALLVFSIGFAALAWIMAVERSHIAARRDQVSEERDHLALLLTQGDQCHCRCPQIDGLHTFGHCDVTW
jgi:hypothetical protein